MCERVPEALGVDFSASVELELLDPGEIAVVRLGG